MLPTLKFYKNLQESTLYLLLPISLICIISGLLYINQIAMKNSWLINRTTDVPFFMVLSLYLFSKFKVTQLSKPKAKPKKINQIIELAAITTFILVIFLFDIFFTNQIPT